MTADCETVITPEGLEIECIYPDTRSIMQTNCVAPYRLSWYSQARERIILPAGAHISIAEQAARAPLHITVLRHADCGHRVAADRAAIEAEGFTLAYERPLWS